MSAEVQVLGPGRYRAGGVEVAVRRRISREGLKGFLMGMQEKAHEGIEESQEKD